MACCLGVLRFIKILAGRSLDASSASIKMYLRSDLPAKFGKSRQGRIPIDAVDTQLKSRELIL